MRMIYVPNKKHDVIGLNCDPRLMSSLLLFGNEISISYIRLTSRTYLVYQLAYYNRDFYLLKYLNKESKKYLFFISYIKFEYNLNKRNLSVRAEKKFIYNLFL